MRVEDRGVYVRGGEGEERGHGGGGVGRRTAHVAVVERDVVAAAAREFVYLMVYLLVVLWSPILLCNVCCV